jgi:thiol-disulfide isomerase/thioredoxin
LLLFGANWCAPCRAELGELPALALAVAPGRLILAWTDVEPRLQAGHPANVRVLSREEARALLGAHASMNAGLPFAVARDVDGKICGFARQRLSPSAAAALVAQCRVRR